VTDEHLEYIDNKHSILDHHESNEHLERRNEHLEFDDEHLEKLDDLHRSIYNVIVMNPQIQYSEIAEKTGIKRSTITRKVKGLRNMGYIVRVDGRRYGYWIILKTLPKAK
jgi:DNA-binding MarR family transcriptional regulator